jgi:hypothetical protein
LKKKEDLFGHFYDLAAEIEEKEGVEVTDTQREEVEKLREDFRCTFGGWGWGVVSGPLCLFSSVALHFFRLFYSCPPPC